MYKYVAAAFVTLVVLTGALIGATLYLFPSTDTADDENLVVPRPPAGQLPVEPAAPVAPAPSPGSVHATLEPPVTITATTSPLLQGKAGRTRLVLVELVDGEKVLWHSQVPVTNGAWGVIATLPASTISGQTYGIVLRANGQPDGDVLARGTVVFKK